jgi:hypothetical protein
MRAILCRMPSGYENSPDYGGPNPGFLFEAIAAVAFVLIVAGVWWMHH